MDLAGMMLKSRIERLAKAIGIENISAGQVSEITKGLEEQVTAFRTRPLKKNIRSCGLTLCMTRSG